jgi:heme/copper-type cytochrome/quinol oxidase subunit 3
MAPRTIFLSRLFGLYCILISVAMMSEKHRTVETVKAMIQDAPLVLFGGIALVIASLAVVLTHNVWRGGAAAVVVTLLGWTALIKGILLVFLQGESRANFFLGTLHYEQWFYYYLGFSLLLGIYLTYEGFKGATH